MNILKLNVFTPTLREKGEGIVLAYLGKVTLEESLKEFLNLPDSLGKKVVIGHGDVSMVAKLEELYPNVEFRGYEDNYQLAYLLANIDVLVSPANVNAVVCANACGTPVAATTGSGTEEHVVDHLNGVIEDDLSIAVINAITLDRQKVRKYVEDI